MFWKTANAIVPAVAACFVALSLTAPAIAGGFGLFVEAPTAASTETDALLIVRAVGCHGPGAAVSAKAEGLVDGKRVSLPLHLEYQGNDTYSLKRQWPTTGAWLVSLSAKSAHPITTTKRSFRPVTNVLVEIESGGNVKNVRDFEDRQTGTTRRLVNVRRLMGEDKSAEISALLKQSAAENKPQPSEQTTASL